MAVDNVALVGFRFATPWHAAFFSLIGLANNIHPNKSLELNPFY